MSRAAHGPRNANWRGGRVVDHFGYVRITVGRNHPMADSNGRVREHRLVMSEALGRPLASKETVHHINGVRDDNRLENLMLFENHAAHIRFERKEMRRLQIENADLRALLGLT